MSNVKLKQTKDTMMKTKTLVMGIVAGAALIASTTVATANPTLTVASGTRGTATRGIPSAFGPGFHVTGVQDPSGSGIYVVNAAFGDGWVVDTATDNPTSGPDRIDFSIGTAGGTTIAPLTITFTSADYGAIAGLWSEFQSGQASSDLTINIKLTDAAGLLNNTTFTGSATPPVTTVGFGSTSPIATGTTGNLGTLTEVVTITPLLNVNQLVSSDGTFIFTPTTVPDGGTTLMLLGSALTGLVGLRSKFGSKQA
jgi:hypothetical protein